MKKTLSIPLPTLISINSIAFHLFFSIPKHIFFNIMAVKFVVALFLTFTLFMTFTCNVSSRELVMPKDLVDDCWNALADIQSCSNEYELFLSKTTSYIDDSCCQPIELITRECYDDMLTKLGFNLNESRALLSYCDDQSALAPASAPTSEE